MGGVVPPVLDRRYAVIEPTMQREAVLQTLSAHKQELSAKYGVTRLGIFGSVAREEASGSSDVHIVVEKPPDLWKMVSVKNRV